MDIRFTSPIFTRLAWMAFLIVLMQITNLNDETKQQILDAESYKGLWNTVKILEQVPTVSYI